MKQRRTRVEEEFSNEETKKSNRETERENGYNEKRNQRWAGHKGKQGKERVHRADLDPDLRTKDMPRGKGKKQKRGKVWKRTKMTAKKEKSTLRPLNSREGGKSEDITSWRDGKRIENKERNKERREETERTVLQKRMKDRRITKHHEEQSETKS